MCQAEVPDASTQSPHQPAPAQVSVRHRRSEPGGFQNPSKTGQSNPHCARSTGLSHLWRTPLITVLEARYWGVRVTYLSGDVRALRPNPFD
jgi:hypothetical protein